MRKKDVHKIALAMTNLTEYLNSKYIKDEDFDKEVIRVTKTLYDPLVEEKGIEKGIEHVALKMILKEKTNEEIMEVTDLQIEAIEKLRGGIK